MLPIIAVYLLWAFWFFLWGLAAIASPKGVRKLHGPEELLYRFITLSAGLLLFTLTPWPGIDVQYRLWERTLDDDITWRLVAVMAAALALAGLSLWHRHRVLRRGALFVTSGPYALVRHPVYACLIVAALATAVIFGRPSSFAGVVLLSLAFAVKTTIEEARILTPAFAAYKHRVAMFVPLLGYVWRLFEHKPGSTKTIPSAPVSTSPPPVAMADAKLGTELGLAPSLRLTAISLDLLLEEDEAPPAQTPPLNTSQVSGL